MADFLVNDGVLLAVSYSKDDNVLVIPNTVRHIKRCLINYSVKKIIIGPSVETIEANAFSEANNLKDIEINNSNFIIKDECLFDINQKILFLAKRDINNSLILPPTLDAIGDYAFAYCGQLRDVKINDNVKYIGTKAFFECFNLSNINLPKNHDLSLNGWTFQSTRLKEIVIPKNIIGLGRMEFYSCDYLEKVIVESTKIKTIPFYCFGNNKNLIRIDFNDGVETIEGCAFADCPELTEVSLSKTVKIIKKDNIFKNDNKVAVCTSSPELIQFCKEKGIDFIEES